jgi:hypothetical protein
MSAIGSPTGIVTYTGRWIEPLTPDPDDIAIEDIAHALSNQCRFTGHVKQFYSVAEHSVRVSYLLGENNYSKAVQWAGLLHDSSEAYLSDIARPVKRSPEISRFYDAAEEGLMTVIAEKFGFKWPMQKAVKWADDVLLRSEQRDLMADGRIPGTTYVSYTIEPWAPDFAEEMFLSRYKSLSG